jgi:hypothetical protein
MHSGTLSIWHFILMILLISPVAASSQSLLNKTISVHVRNQPLVSVLKDMEQQGGFNFSYNSNTLRPDSLITLNADDQPIINALHTLFQNKFEIRENHNFIILRYAPGRLSLTAERAASNQSYITGYITDEQNGKRIASAIVSAGTPSQSVWSDQDGYFELNVTGNSNQVLLTASKPFYKDTSIVSLNDIAVVGSNKWAFANYTAHLWHELPTLWQTNAVTYNWLGQAKGQQSKAKTSRFEATRPVITNNRSIPGDMMINGLLPNRFGGYNAGTALKLKRGIKIWTSVFIPRQLP